jgi:mono/diheme cytochrome c family protein
VKGAIICGLSLRAMLCVAVYFYAVGPVWAANAQRGRALYFGEQTQTASVAGANLPGHKSACVNCHRHSALGGFEADMAVPAIAGRYLFQAASTLTGHTLPWAVEQNERPAYTVESLHAALTRGVSPTGRTLRAVMPRYQMSQQDVADISAYLAQIDGRVPPGVEAEKIYLATVVTPDVSVSDRNAMLRTLEAYVAAKNAATRQERARSNVSARSQQQMYRNYRSWELLTWTLEGEPNTWSAQLAALFAQRPVFGMVGGMSGADWTAIHMFCEQHELPCLLPQLQQTPFLKHASEAFFNVYFHEGLPARLRTASQWMKMHKVSKVEIASGAPSGLAQALTLLELQPLEASGAQRAREQSELVPVISVQSDQMLSIALTFVEAGSPTTSRVLVADAPPNQVNARSKAWMQRHGLDGLPSSITGKALQAATAMAEMLAHADLSFSAAYCLERLEHGLESMPNYTAFQRLSLAPGQRFAAKGSFIGTPGANQALRWTWWQP